MSGVSTYPFTKWVGSGNDFVVVDAVRRPWVALRRRWPAVSRMLCDRHAGVGADGLLVLERSKAADARMRVFNPDGSEAEMCGNGARCVARYVSERGRANGRPVTIETRAGILSARVRRGRVAMRMADPTGLRLNATVQVEGRSLTLSQVNTGVPHVVVPVAAIDQVAVATLGRAIRAHRAFAPDGTNVNFMQPDPSRPGRIRIRTYERGVEGETLACGTGAVACAIIAGLSRAPSSRAASAPGALAPHRVEVQVHSGELLTVSFRAARRPPQPMHGYGGRPSGAQVTDVVLEGSAQRVFEGAIRWPVGPRQVGGSWRR